MNRVATLIRDDSGSISSLTVIMLAVFIALLAYVIDLGHLHTVQNELRNAADACALRGARAFVPDDIPVTETSPIPMDPDPLNAKTQASRSIGDNRSDNVALTDLPLGEIQVGIWYFKAAEECPDPAQPLQPWGWPPPSSEWGKYIGPGISLTTKRDASHNSGPVGMTLAKLFGLNTVAVGGPKTTQATAALGAWGGPFAGTPTFPGGPSTGTIPKPGDGQFPNYHATMRDDSSDTFGWSDLSPDGKTNAADLKKILKDPTSTPDCPPGSEVGIQNGVVADAITTMVAKNNIFGLEETSKGSNVYVPDAAHADIIYTLPVFETIPDDKFNQTSIVGGVQVKITQVSTSPENTIDFIIIGPGGGSVLPGYGGGRWYGILSTVPKLVQ